MKVNSGTSHIHGIGVFAGEDAPTGTVLGGGDHRAKDWITRHINHQRTGRANVTIYHRSDDWPVFVTAREVTAGEELTLDYGELPGYGTVDVWYLAEFVAFSLAQDGQREAFEEWLANGGAGRGTVARTSTLL